jgi:hypothetical protein
MSEQHKHDDQQGQSNVTIEMDSKPYSIHRGHQTVAAIKSACGVNPTWVIELIGEDGTPQLLDDNAAVTIKGGERFISHVRGGGSS